MAEKKQGKALDFFIWTPVMGRSVGPIGDILNESNKKFKKNRKATGLLLCKTDWDRIIS
jgi:hypothetical protein